MRGVSPLISHTLDLAIIIAVFTLIIVHVSSIKSQTEEQFLNYQTFYIATKITEEVSFLENTYADSSYSPSSTAVLASLDIPFSSKIPLRAELLSGVVRVTGVTSSGKEINNSRVLQTNFQSSGAAKLPAKLVLEKLGNSYTVRVVE